MAEREGLTAREAVRQVLAGEHADVLRERVATIVREIMELEMGQPAGAELGERARVVGRRSATGIGSAVGHQVMPVLRMRTRERIDPLGASCGDDWRLGRVPEDRPTMERQPPDTGSSPPNDP